MNSKAFINPITLERQDFRKESPFVIIDNNGNMLAAFSRLYDAAICLRFIVGKSMSRSECDLAEKLLNNADNGGNERIEKIFWSEKNAAADPDERGGNDDETE